MKIAIVDNEKSTVQEIRKMVLKCCPENCESDIQSFTSAIAFINDYDNGNRYDIIFMDIEIGDSNGIEVVEHIREVDLDVIVIFITSYSDYVTNAFRVGAFQYLQKPFTETDFRKDFYRAIDSYQLKHALYEFKSDNKRIAIAHKEIYYLEIYNKKIKIYTKDDNIIEDGRSSIKDKEKLLKAYDFIRCHNSYLVNLYKIKVVGNDFLLLDNDIQVPMSRNFRPKVFSQFNTFLSRRKV